METQARFDKCLCGLLPGGGGAVLLAVSGGIDSMVMADLFLNSSLEVRFSVAHCNFHLRGAESDSDETFVRQWAESHGLPFLKADFATAEYASSNGISIEMAARDLRYSWFASECGRLGFKAVCAAHNANDNAETLFLNLLRGTGLKGICGMRESSIVPGSKDALLLRPLLCFTRKEIRDHALSRGLSWREDSSNGVSAYKRNLIRNEVFPLLERINPSFISTLAEDMTRFSQAQSIADDYFMPFDSGSGAEGVSIDVGRLLLQKHWKYLLYRILEPYGFNQSSLDNLYRLLGDRSATFSGRRFYSPGFVAVTSRETITVSPLRVSNETKPEAESSVLVAGPGEYSLGEVRFLVEEVEVSDPRTESGTTVMDLGFPFTVRLWRPGDWMRPLGMGGRGKKISDMFGDLKLPPRQKERALVVDGGESHVLALIGHRIDESVKVPSSTKAIFPAVRIRLV